MQLKFTTPILTEKDNFDVSESDGALIVTVEPLRNQTIHRI